MCSSEEATSSACIRRRSGSTSHESLLSSSVPERGERKDVTARSNPLCEISLNFLGDAFSKLSLFQSSICTPLPSPCLLLSFHHPLHHRLCPEQVSANPALSSCLSKCTLKRPVTRVPRLRPFLLASRRRPLPHSPRLPSSLSSTRSSLPPLPNTARVIVRTRTRTRLVLHAASLRLRLQRTRPIADSKSMRGLIPSTRSRVTHRRSGSSRRLSTPNSTNATRKQSWTRTSCSPGVTEVQTCLTRLLQGTLDSRTARPRKSPSEFRSPFRFIDAFRVLNCL